MREAGLSSIGRAIFEGALTDCGIERAFAERVQTLDRAGTSSHLLFGNHLVDFDRLRYLRVIAAGKAGHPMLAALMARLPRLPHVDVRGILIARDAPVLPAGFAFYPGGHPFPNAASFAGAGAALLMLQTLPPDASPENCLCLFLISGGSSSMMELPLVPNISLEDTIAFHRALVHSGASIVEINCLRKHFSAVKGGRLAAAARPAASLGILLSDVPAGNLDTIGSGPTLPDSSTVDDCREILSRYNLMDQFPQSIRSFFASAEMPETLKPGELSAATWTILNSDDLLNSARLRAERLGFSTVVDNTCDDWNFREAATYLLKRIRELRSGGKRVCLLSSGELVVRPIPPDRPDHRAALISGNGGRNQHFALYAATLFSDTDAPIAVLSAGSDGIDGHSHAAGAVVTSRTLIGSDALSTCRRRKDAEQALATFHSSTFLHALGSTIVTGPTGNNLRDLRLLLVE